MDLKGKSVTVNGLRIRYVRRGDGPHVLLVHGLGAALDYWDENIGPLSERFTVTALDLPWFGKSTIPDARPDLSYFLSVLHAFCETLGLERITPVGNSLGGALAAALAGKYPELVDKVVLVSPGGFGREVSPTLRLLSLPLVGSMILRPSRAIAEQTVRALFHDPSRVKERWIDAAHAYFKSPVARRAFLRVTRESVGLLGQRSGPVSEVTQLARNIRARTLVIWGREDRVIPDLHLKRVTEIIPDCVSYTFDNCGHVPMMEKPDEFNRMVSRFILEGHIGQQDGDGRLSM